MTERIQRQIVTALISVGIGTAFILSGQEERLTATAPAAPYQRVQNWPQWPSGKTFGAVASVAVDAKRNVFAIDRDTGQILQFDPDGRFAGFWGGGASFAKPKPSSGAVNEGSAHHLMIDRSGFFWVVDRDRQVVRKFTQEGKPVLVLGKEDVFGQTPETFNGPTRVRQLSNGNFVVADGYWNSRLVWFDRNGKFLKTVGTYGRGPGQFGTLHDFVEDSRGRLLVVDLCNGVYVPQIMKPGQVDERRRTPGDSCNGKDERIQVLDRDGNHVANWLQGQIRPLAIAVRGNDVYVGDGMKILVLNGETGAVIDKVDAKGTLHSIEVDRDGDVYATGFVAPDLLARYSRAAPVHR